MSPDFFVGLSLGFVLALLIAAFVIHGLVKKHNELKRQLAGQGKPPVGQVTQLRPK